MLIADYLKIESKHEHKSGNSFKRYKDINTDHFSWKHLEHEVRENPQSMYEVMMDTSDSVLMGSSSGYMTTSDEVLNRYHVSKNHLKLHKDAYWMGCMANTNCSETVYISTSDIINHHIAQVYNESSTTSMTNEEWEEAHAKADELHRMANGDQSSDEFFALIDEYFKDILTVEI